MIGWFLNKFTNALVALDFMDDEARSSTAHNQAEERRFDTRGLEREAVAKMAGPLTVAAAQFTAPIAVVADTIRQLFLLLALDELVLQVTIA